MVARLAKPGADIIASLTPVKAHLWHMASCIMGEVAELLTAIESCDGDNILEELGDIEFYLEGYRQGANISASDLTGEPTVDDEPRLLVQVSADLFDVTKKVVIYNKCPIDRAKAIQHLTDINHLLYQVRHGYGWSHQDVLDANYRKLSKRYPEGGYTDQAATVRADKHILVSYCDPSFGGTDKGVCGVGLIVQGPVHDLDGVFVDPPAEATGGVSFVPNPPEFDSEAERIRLERLAEYRAIPPLAPAPPELGNHEELITLIDSRITKALVKLMGGRP